MNTSKQDIVFQSVLKDLQSKFEKKFNTKISLKQLLVIIEIQNELVGNAVYTGQGIRLPNLGKFQISPKKSAHLGMEQIEKQQRLQTSGSLIPADYAIGY